MKKKIVIFFFLSVSISLFSENTFSQDIFSYSKVIYQHDSHYYNEIYLSCMEDGIALLSYRKPISVAELFVNYNWIDSNNLSKQGSIAYNELSKLFYNKKPAFSKGRFALDYNVDMAIEARYLHNPKSEPNIDKIYRYNKSQAPIKIPLEFYLSKYAYSYFVPLIEKNYSGFNLSYPYTNLPLEQKALDFHFPKQTGLSVGNSFFNAQIGRGSLNVGKTLSGSMLIADLADRLDFFNISAFFDFVKMDISVAELAPTSFFISHELSIRPVKQFSMTFHEGIMLDSVFDPKFLNPFMIFHNYAPWKKAYVGHEYDENSIGCQLGLDINIVPIKNLRIYGQFGMNQFQTPSEIRGGANTIPNSMGGIAGIEYIFPVLDGHLILSGEFEYADPWLYIGLGGHQASFFYYRKENVFASESYEASRIDLWLANPHGPDSIAGLFKIEFIKQRKYNIELLYRFLAKGENEKIFFEKARENVYYYPSEEKQAKTTLSREESLKMARYKTPSKNAIYFNTIGLSGKYNVWKGLDIKAKLSCTIASGKISGKSIDFSTAISYSIR